MQGDVTTDETKESWKGKENVKVNVQIAAHSKGLTAHRKASLLISNKSSVCKQVPAPLI